MKIAFATTLSAQGSTNIGRVFPLARAIALDENDVHVLLLGSEKPDLKYVTTHSVGQEPFTRTESGKKRLRGLRLILNMLNTAFKTFTTLNSLKPDVVVIVKPLPHNTLGVKLLKLLNNKTKIILDVDDFELTANHLTSLVQRASIHWAERSASKMSHAIMVATPFLSDHFKLLTANQKPVHIIPTGLDTPGVSPSDSPGVASVRHILYIGSVSDSSGHKVFMLPEILTNVHQQHPNAQLIIAGDGHDTDKLKAEFKKQNLDKFVTWHGRFTSADIPTLLSETSIIIDPIDASTTNRAKSSYRVALATASGIPVVTSNIGIRPHLIPDSLHSNFLAKPLDAASYADKISGLLANPISAETQQELIQHSRQFTWETLCQKYLQAIT